MRQPCSATTVCSCEYRSRHSRTRRGEMKCSRISCSCLRDDSFGVPPTAAPWRACPPRLASSQSHSFRSPRNSLRSSANFLCALSAACCCSSGRSRTSCTLNALATISTSAKRLAIARLEDHAAHARVERQPGQFPADRREFVAFVHRTEFGEQLVTVGNRAARWRLQERKVVHVASRATSFAGSRRPATNA